MLKPLTCAAILVAASTPALASGEEMRREQASGDPRGFDAAMRRVMMVAAAVAERDYPQLGAGWKACRAQLVTTDGGQTYH
jgi:hypothetical protein